MPHCPSEALDFVYFTLRRTMYLTNEVNWEGVDFSDMGSFCHCPISSVAFCWVFNLLFLTWRLFAVSVGRCQFAHWQHRSETGELLILELQPGWRQKEPVQESFRDSYWGQLHLWHLRWEATLNVMKENILELCVAALHQIILQCYPICLLTGSPQPLKLRFWWYPWFSGP